MNPAGASTESLTSNPELENSLDPEQTFVTLISAKVLRGTEFIPDLHIKSIRLFRV